MNVNFDVAVDAVMAEMENDHDYDPEWDYREDAERYVHAIFAKSKPMVSGTQGQDPAGRLYMVGGMAVEAIQFAEDGSNCEAVDALIDPTFPELVKAGEGYRKPWPELVPIDTNESPMYLERGQWLVRHANGALSRHLFEPAYVVDRMYGERKHGEPWVRPLLPGSGWWLHDTEGAERMVQYRLSDGWTTPWEAVSADEIARERAGIKAR